MPTVKLFEKMSAAVDRGVPTELPLAPDDDLPFEYWQALLDDPRAAVRPGIPSGGALRLNQIPQHILRVDCRRCGRAVEIQNVIRLAILTP
jgi:hypothetical protein